MGRCAVRHRPFSLPRSIGEAVDVLRGGRSVDRHSVHVEFLMAAGHEATVNLIGSGVLALLGHPEQLDRLRRAPELLKPAVEELARFTSPVEVATERYARGRGDRTGTWRSGWEPTTAWARRSPGWRRRSPSERCWSARRSCGSPSTLRGALAAACLPAWPPGAPAGVLGSPCHRDSAAAPRQSRGRGHSPHKVGLVGPPSPRLGSNGTTWKRPFATAQSHRGPTRVPGWRKRTGRRSCTVRSGTEPRGRAEDHRGPRRARSTPRAHDFQLDVVKSSCGEAWPASRSPGAGCEVTKDNGIRDALSEPLMNN